jgi:hypothetical protein
VDIAGRGDQYIGGPSVPRPCRGYVAFLA